MTGALPRGDYNRRSPGSSRAKTELPGLWLGVRELGGTVAVICKTMEGAIFRLR